MAAPVRQMPQQATQQDTGQMRPADPGRGSRAVLWTGLVAGISVVVLAMGHGIRLRLPVRPSFLATVGGFLVETIILTGVACWTAHLVRRHHRRVIRYAVTGAQQGTLAAGRAAGRHGRRAHGWARRRWEGRGESWRTPLVISRQEIPADDGEPEPAPDEDVLLAPRECGTRPRRLEIVKPGSMDLADGDDGPYLRLRDWVFRDPSLPADAVVHLDSDGLKRALRGYSLAELHEMAHGRNCRCPVSDLIAAGAPAPAANPNGGNVAPPTAPPAAPAVRRSAMPAPGSWDPLVSDTRDFEADDETELLDWMADQVKGMVAYSEAVADVQEHHVSDAIRLDPAAMAALHDVADAVAEAASAMAIAREKYKEVYEAPRQFVAEGGVLPKDGDFTTGEGD